MLRKSLSIFALAILAGINSNAQINLKVNKRSVDAATKGVKALTFSDADAAKLAKEAVDWMDTHNEVAGPNDPYTRRLERIFGKHKNEDGLALNYKVYKVIDINAFACADGSVRVFSSLMDIMTDDELLAVIGHEIGHVHNHDTRDAMRDAYKRAALTDAVASQSGAIATLTDSQLGDLAAGMLSSKFSRKQESEADDYSYEFLKRNNYNVMAEVTAFQKLAKLSEGAPEQSKTEKMFNSHPDSDKRAKKISEKATKDGLYKETALVYPKSGGDPEPEVKKTTPAKSTKGKKK